MNRRDFVRLGLAALGVGTLSVAISDCAALPVIPKRPTADSGTALGWISHAEGAYTLLLPRAEMGQNIATALKQIACEELGIEWSRLTITLQDTQRMEVVRATVGSDSVKDYAEPLAQACATLRDALASGRQSGRLRVVNRPVSELRAFREGRFVGSSPQIVHGVEIVTGEPLFAADIRLDRMIYGRVLRAPVSPEVDVRPARWDEAAARAVPGFVGLVDDAGLSLGGNRGLGVLAKTPAALDRIAAALAVGWSVGGDAMPRDIEAAIDVDTRLQRGNLDNAVVKGRVEEGAPWDVDIRIDVPFAAHGPIEPRAAVARFQNGSLELWAGSQDVFYIRDVLADEFGLSTDQVRVHACRIGGAFGGKTICTVEREAAVLARATGRPVKMQWTRAQELALGFHRPPVSHRIRARLDDGRITDWRNAFVSSHILFTSAVLPPWLQGLIGTFAGDGGVARGSLPPYRTGRTRVDYDLVRLPVHTGPWRGLGAGPNVLAIEMAMDEAARAAGADPVAFRLAHIEDERLAATLSQVADLAKWGEAAAERPGMRVGRGVACGIYKDMSYAAVVADVAVDAGGRVRVTRLWCAHDCGRVINPDQVRAQCEGNLVWGVGMILSDRLAVDDGAVGAQTFADAPIPTMAEVPEMTIALLPSTAPPTGAGETAIVAAPGAIANAVRAATGFRPTRFPLDPSLFRTT